MSNGNFNCLYCGNPSATVRRLSQWSCSFGVSIKQVGVGGSGPQYQVINSPLEVSCPFCGRKYLILATSNNSNQDNDFIQDILEHLDFEDEKMIAQELVRYNIEPEDLFNNVYAIVIPKGFVNGTKQWISAKVRKVAYEIHILFTSKGQNFYLSAYRNNSTGEIIGKHIEKVR